MKQYLKQVFDDKLFWGVMLFFGLVILLLALFVPVSEDIPFEENSEMEYTDGWNTIDMIPAEGVDGEEADSIFQIKGIYASEADFPKGLKIKWANIQDSRVLVVFERYRDLNPAYDRDYMAVYDVSGEWMYGFEGILPYSSTKIALMPECEGIVFWEWRTKQTNRELFMVVNPDGNKQMLVSEDIWSDTPAYWKSEYRVIHTKESKLVVTHADTDVQMVVFDYSDVYPMRYPQSSKIDEEQEMVLDGLVPIFFMFVIILLLPWMMDNPNIPKRGVKEVHGDLRDRHS